MLIQNAVKIVESVPDSWMRVVQVLRISGRLEICFSVHRGKRGKRVDQWRITCRGVHEAQITDWDLGGLRLYPSTHPAARQFVARWAELRWPRPCDEARVFLALHRAHIKAVDDWVPFESYLQIETPWTGSCFAPISGSNFVCRSPEFLVRAYAKALEAIGERAQITLRRASKLKPTKPKVLHFGNSYVLANTFTAERVAIGPS
jgi:hypothetical protein